MIGELRSQMGDYEAAAGSQQHPWAEGQRKVVPLSQTHVPYSGTMQAHGALVGARDCSPATDSPTGLCGGSISSLSPASHEGLPLAERSGEHGHRDEGPIKHNESGTLLGQAVSFCKSQDG